MYTYFNIFFAELVYEDVFRVWETIWSARRLVCNDFGPFIALSLVQCYRDIILHYDMDFTDIIRFYNGNKLF
ncbi:unnamed protein product [Protopolystoma xenopodis]|uniref:Rab-GAP TBC domain-containing protein n=1 Tax=Protopolystoma xenopodis TaxID=117903 RepID=A0A448WHH8_9PLAT|nr:unnamed protein product [Protopolystoma xenopodis]